MQKPDTKSSKRLENFWKLGERPPAVGSTVHYGMKGSARAAIVSDVDMLSLDGRVSLTVFPPGGPSFSIDAIYSDQLKNGYWTWPPL